MKALIQDIERRFGRLPSGYRAIVAGIRAVLVLYKAIDIRRALYWFAP